MADLLPRSASLDFISKLSDGFGRPAYRFHPGMNHAQVLVRMHESFRKFARWSAEVLGSAEAFLVAVAAILLWAALGPRYHFSDTWQLVINTATSIVTVLMVFIIQNTQNRDAKAIQLKLDELIRGVTGARTALVRLEDLSDEDLRKLTKDFQKLREGMPEVDGSPGPVSS